MPALARNQTSDCDSPILDLFTQVNGVLTDVAVLEFIILDKTGPSPLQVFPVTGRGAVDTAALCPVGGKLSTGHFVAEYTPPLTENIGTHAIQWFFRLTPTSPEQTFEEEFEVLAEVVGTGQIAYCPIQDLRDEGFTSQQASDARLAQLIELASRYIDGVTERFFEPRQQTLELDGRGAPDLLLDEPIIAVEEIEILDQGIGGVPVTGVVDSSSYRVYNRHLTQRLAKPDDRDNPKISFIRNGVEPRALLGRGFVFPRGVQNVRLKGLFGYTEADGSPTGRTPLLIRDVCKRLVVRDLPLLSEAGKREDAQKRWRLLEEKTRDQSYKLDKLVLRGAFTGDPAIDNVLVQFKRPADLGAA